MSDYIATTREHYQELTRSPMPFGGAVTGDETLGDFGVVWGS